MARRFTRTVTTPAAARLPQTGNRPFVSLTSDWGVRDPSPAICRAVVLGIAPDALIVDITHEVDKYNIRHGALMLWCALPFLPIGAHVCVVDPGVGTSRRPIAIETGRGDYLVGPDNGVLLPGAERIGGVARVHQIDNTQYRLPVVSATFHGRDLFTPAAAHLAMGVPLDAIGPAIDPSDLTRIEWPTAQVRRGELQTNVVYRDTFGNVKLGASSSDLQAAVPGIVYGDKVVVTFGASARATPTEMTWAQTFGDIAAKGFLVYEDSYGRLCVAQNQGDAVRALKVDDDSRVVISRPAAGQARTGQTRLKQPNRKRRAPEK
jgi:S-adenosylmethionine hydrolase